MGRELDTACVYKNIESRKLETALELCLFLIQTLDSVFIEMLAVVCYGKWRLIKRWEKTRYFSKRTRVCINSKEETRYTRHEFVSRLRFRACRKFITTQLPDVTIGCKPA